MIINSLTLTDGEGPGRWTLEHCEFRPYLNLIVGASGTGKSKLLNAIFNLGHLAVTDGLTLGTMRATVEFTITDTKYRWNVAITKSANSSEIADECLEIIGGEKIIERNGSVVSLRGKPVPKLPRESSAIRTLREEDDIAPIHSGFASIRRRTFQGNELENAKSLQTVPAELIESCRRGSKINILYQNNILLNVTTKLLKDYYSPKFRTVVDQFRRVFPTVEDVQVVDAQSVGAPVIGNPPLLMLKERDVPGMIPIMEWSSGMIKVLLLIVDVVTQPKPSIYMVDEYENSLGVNAIDFFPSLVAEFGDEVQFFVTSHHPMLINAMSINDWIVLGRRGSTVRALYGEALKERYGVSHHEQYVKLLNDPFFQRGQN